jgi:hypothetical protein
MFKEFFTLPQEVAFLLSSEGEMILFEHTPDTIKDAIQKLI